MVLENSYIRILIKRVIEEGVNQKLEVFWEEEKDPTKIYGRGSNEMKIFLHLVILFRRVRIFRNVKNILMWR